MKYVVIMELPNFPVGYVYDSEDPDAPKSLARIFSQHPDWFRIVDEDGIFTSEEGSK